ncbi:MAG: hypothetical protein U0451_00190 [Candidatus Saccharimonadales bacterium]
MKQNLHRLDYRLSIGRVLQIAAVGLLLAASAAQVFLGVGVNKADAAQLTARKVTISDSEISATGVSYTFNFTTATASAIQGVRLQFCTQPLGTCTVPTGLDVSTAAVQAATQTWTNAGDFADNGSLDEGACTEATNTTREYCLERALATSESAGGKQFTLTGVTNPNSQTSIYVRIATYSDTAFATAVDDGVVAAATARQLTVNGRVQERLEFCVSAADDADTLPAQCSAMGSNTTIDLGVIDNTAVKIAPQNETNNDGANDDFGLAQINTNAASGVVLSYFPENAASGTDQLWAFRVTGATCSATPSVKTDQCFVNGTGAASEFDAGDEAFGLTVACVDNTQGTTTNITTSVDAYDGDDDSIAMAADCENEGETEFAWANSETATTLASSSSVVDDEIVKLRFGARAAATTPTGSYTVTSTYIATPTF